MAPETVNSMPVTVRSRTGNALRTLADKVDAQVMAVFALLASFGRLPAGLEAFWADTRAQENPIREVAVGFILIAIALVIALTILPVITSAVNTAAGDGNISASDVVLLRLIPTLLIVGLMAGGVVFLFQAFKKVRG